MKEEDIVDDRDCIHYCKGCNIILLTVSEILIVYWRRRIIE